MEIKEALAQLDHANDEHWTADGAPRVEVVAELTGNKDLKRKDITDAAPKFTRQTEKDEDVAEQAEESLAPETVEQALALKAEDFVADRGLFPAAIKLMDDHINDMVNEINDLKIEVERVRAQLASLRQFEIDTSPKINANSAFIKRQNEIRAAKVAKRQAALGQLTAEDLKEAFGTKSPLDEALSSRKAEAGSTRPARLSTTTE